MGSNDADDDLVTHIAEGAAMTEGFHSRLHHVAGTGLGADTAQTEGMRRVEAISGKTVGSRNLWMGRTHVHPATTSGNHHHGESETAIFVTSGNPVFVFIEDGIERRIETAPGDFVFVPPFVPHREENPSETEEAIVVIARTTQEAIVVNVDAL